MALRRDFQATTFTPLSLLVMLCSVMAGIEIEEHKPHELVQVINFCATIGVTIYI